MRDVLRSGRLSLGPMLERFEREFAAWVGSDDAVAVSSGTAALHLAVRGARLGRRGRGRHHAAELRRLGELPAVRAGGAGLLRHRRAHAQHRPGCGRRGVRPSARSGLLPVHLFGYPADMEALEALAAATWPGHRRGRVRGARRRRLRRVPGSERSGNPAAFGFYANKQLVTGEGGMLTCGDREVGSRASAASATRAARDDMDWLAHDRLGFNYRLSDVAAALGVAQVERSTRCSRERERVARALPRAAGRHRGPRAALRGPRQGAPQLVRLRRAGAGRSRPRRA